MSLYLYRGVLHIVSSIVSNRVASTVYSSVSNSVSSSVASIGGATVCCVVSLIRISSVSVAYQYWRCYGVSLFRISAMCCYTSF